MKMKRIVSILIATCVTVSIIGSSFAGGKNETSKGKDSSSSEPSFMVQLVPEAPVSQEAIHEYIKSGGTFHYEKSTTGGSITAQYNKGVAHEGMALQALNILKNDKGSTIYNKLGLDTYYNPSIGGYSWFTTNVKFYSWYADEVESDGVTICLGHFYGLGGTNYLPFNNTSPTALY